MKMFVSSAIKIQSKSAFKQKQLMCNMNSGHLTSSLTSTGQCSVRVVLCCERVYFGRLHCTYTEAQPLLLDLVASEARGRLASQHWLFFGVKAKRLEL